MLSCSFFVALLFFLQNDSSLYNTVFNSLYYICILPFLDWYSTGRWAISWFCLQHWLWTLSPLWGFPVTKQQLEGNMKFTKSLSAQCYTDYTSSSSVLSNRDEISLLYNRQINLKQGFVTSTHADRKTKYLLFSSICRGKVFVISKTLCYKPLQTQQFSTPC